MGAITLTADDRGFLRLVDQATFANPFTTARAQLNARLCGRAADTDPATLVDAAIAAVDRHVQRLALAGLAHLERHSGEDRRLVRSALLFSAFHRDLDNFDHHIRQQLTAGDAPCKVGFAADALAQLAAAGFSHDEQLRSFAFFFQLRRAFYFIHNGLPGSSACMRQLRGQLWDNIFTANPRWYEDVLWERMEDFSTLLLGETGAGKGSAAAAIGRSMFIPFDPARGTFRESFTRAFIATNLSEYSSTLIESELFGHRKGAFTGAVDPHEGLLARCSPHGAIFLDEIGDIEPELQIKLLRVLQERIFTPVGSHQAHRFSGRVIAATNRPLDRLRTEGRFRDDLYYRLCTDLIVIPPLRQRLQEDPAELPALVGHLLQRILGHAAPQMAAQLTDQLQRSPGPDYPWHGNVRELEQALRRLLLGRPWTGEPPRDEPPTVSPLTADTPSARTLLSRYCRELYQQHGTYEAVARLSGLDRRTAKKYVDDADHD